MITRKNHKKCIIRVGDTALSSILNAILEADCPTRKSIAEQTGYSEMTVGKVMQAIYSSALADKDIRKPVDNGRVCAHLTYSDNISFLVIDISTRNFTMSLISSALSYDFHYSYTYSDSLRYEENLLIFLNGGAQRLEGLNFEFSASILIADNLGGRQCISHNSRTMPLKICDVSFIRDKICDALGYAPDLVITPDVAIKQYLLSKADVDSAYMLVGQTLSMYYLSKAGNLTVCKPWNIITDGVTLKEYLCLSGDISVIFSSVARLINTLDSTFSPKHITVQSDSLALGRDFANETGEFLSGLYNTDRSLKVLDSPYLAQTAGGALALRKWLIKKLIVSFENKKA